MTERSSSRGRGFFLAACLVFLLCVSPLAHASDDVEHKAGFDLLWMTSFLADGYYADLDEQWLTVDVDGNAVIGTQEVSTTSSYKDLVTWQFDESGNVSWRAIYDSPYALTDVVLGVQAADDGSVYVAGVVCVASGCAQVEAVLLKYDATGALAWSYVGNYPDEGSGFNGVAIDGDGNVFAFGWAYESEDHEGPLLAKFEADGNVSWSRVFSEGDWPQGVFRHGVVDSAGDIYLAGNATDSENNALVAKYAADGDLAWYDRFDTSVYSSLRAIALDSEENALVAGTMDVETAAKTTLKTMLAVKYQPNGTKAWTLQHQCGDGSLNCYGRALAVGPVDQLILIGLVQVTTSSYDLLTTAYDVDGDLSWQDTYREDTYGFVLPKDMALDGDGNVFVAALRATNSSHLDYEIAIVGYDASGSTRTELLPEISSINIEEKVQIETDLYGAPIIFGQYASPVKDECPYYTCYFVAKYVDCAGCYVDGACWEDGDVNPDNVCEICHVSFSRTEWDGNDGVSCEDDLFCNGDDTCNGTSCDHTGDPCESGYHCREETDECILSTDDDATDDDTADDDTTDDDTVDDDSADDDTVDDDTSDDDSDDDTVDDDTSDDDSDDDTTDDDTDDDDTADDDTTTDDDAVDDDTDNDSDDDQDDDSLDDDNVNGPDDDTKSESSGGGCGC